MDRRTFVEALGALLMAANAPLRGEVHALGDTASNPLPGSQGTRIRLVPLPTSTSGVRTPVLGLAGAWKFNAQPTADFWKKGVDTSAWSNVEMPNEFAMLGFPITPNREYPCARKLRIPADYADRRIFLRFDGVYGYARVWINGVFVRDHFGGFTSWDCDITDHVKAGEDANLVVGVTDRSDDISQASYYAKHSIAGILRNVRLFAVPRQYLRSLVLSAELDAKYQDGVLHLVAELSSQDYNSAHLEWTLKDDIGKEVSLEPRRMAMSPHNQQTAQTIHVPVPRRWDAEHPNLYLLEVSVSVDGKVTETLQRTIGFRTVERAGSQLLVNGQPVKLRGVCRHSIHPVYGRAVPAEFDAMDAVLFRAANINFVRTSHYPPTEQFLDACDRHGIYVEEETAVCWAQVEGGPSPNLELTGASSNPEYTSRFLSQFQEMIVRDRDHASVLFWSLGNESQWGKNFAVERQFATENDPARPMIFSYPDTVPLTVPAFDIYSKHYADVSSGLSSETYPLLNDEFAHVSCYNLDTLRRDPGVRNFWGESIRRFGDKFLSADGCLGGSIWAGIDEVFLLPEGPAGYGPWGLIDGWRREKPEYWLTKKAYSPIRIEDRPIAAPEKGSPLTIPVTNAFDHTNLKEIDIRWSAGADSHRLPSVDVPPHRSGYLEMPAHNWEAGDTLQLEFRARGMLIDQFRLAIDPLPPPRPPRPQAARAGLRKSGDDLIVIGPNFTVTFSQSTGLIREAVFDGPVILQGGPYVDFGEGPLSSHWQLRSCEAATDGDTVTILTLGECKRGEGIETTPVEFEIQIDGCGLITTRYRIHGNPGDVPLGVAYLLPAAIDRLSWHCESLWSVYPEDHIGRPKGVALKHANHPALRYGSKPEWPWSEDTGDFFLWGKQDASNRPSNDFRSLKENIWYAACSLAGSSVRARAEAGADIAVRAAVLPGGMVSFSLYNFWPYRDLGWGNFTGPGAAPALTSREVKLRLTNLAEDEQENRKS